MKELQPKKPKEEEKPWKETHNYNYLFEKDVKRLKGDQLSNKEIVSTHKYLTVRITNIMKLIVSINI